MHKESHLCPIYVCSFLRRIGQGKREKDVSTFRVYMQQKIQPVDFSNTFQIIMDFPKIITLLFGSL